MQFILKCQGKRIIIYRYVYTHKIHKSDKIQKYENLNLGYKALLYHSCDFAVSFWLFPNKMIFKNFQQNHSRLRT